MLSYRHVFHAGNLGDVLKHLCLLATLRASTRKASPTCYLESHAGAGLYGLPDDAPSAEWHTGIGALWTKSERPGDAPTDLLLQDYLSLVRHAQRYAHIVDPGLVDPGLVDPGLVDAPRVAAASADPQASQAYVPLQVYPGSPWFARACLRAGDRLWLAELHPTDAPLLEQTMQLYLELGTVRQADVHVRQTDGYGVLAANLPPRERRGVVLIDPAYELADEHDRAMRALTAALGRFAHGVYLLWAPSRGKAEPARMERDLLRLRPAKLLRAGFAPTDTAVARAVAARRAAPLGSVVWLINPPYQVDVQLRATFAACAELLNVDTDVRWLLGS